MRGKRSVFELEVILKPLDLVYLGSFKMRRITEEFEESASSVPEVEGEARQIEDTENSVSEIEASQADSTREPKKLIK